MIPFSKEKSTLPLITTNKNERILFENLHFFQKSPPSINNDILKESYEQTARLDYSQLMPTESKKDRELQFLLTKMMKSHEVCLHEFDNIKNTIYKYLIKYKTELGGDELLILTMHLLDQWDSEIYSKLALESRDGYNNLTLYTNFNSDKTLKIKIEHNFAWNFFKNERKFVENLVTFANILKLNNNVMIGDFWNQDILKKIEFLRKIGPLCFLLVLEIRISANLRKVSVNIGLRIEKHFPLQFLQKNKSAFTNFNVNISNFLDKVANNKYIIPCTFGMSLAKNYENVLGFQFFGNGLKKTILTLINRNFTEVKKNEMIITSLKAKDFLFEVKFDNVQFLEWELLYSKYSDDELINNIGKNKFAAFLMKNITPAAKKNDIGLHFGSNLTYFVKKFRQIKANENKIESYFDEEKL